MGLLTLAEMETELFLRCDTVTELDPSTVSGRARCDRALNLSYYRTQLPNVFKHPEVQTNQTITLVTGTTSYPITLFIIDHVQYPFYFKRLRPMTRRQASGLRVPSGPPARWARWGGIMYLDFTPSTAENGQQLIAWGYNPPVALASSNAASILATVWDEIILVGGVWRAWRSLGEQVKADTAREEYGALVNDTVDVMRQEADDIGWLNEVGPGQYQSGRY